MQKIAIIILSLTLLFSGCANINYQERPEHTPNGYSETRLDNGQYIVVYETFKEGGSHSSLEDLALKRAAEITRDQNKSFFKVLSNTYEEYQDKVNIPEQVLRSTYKVPDGYGSMMGGSVREQSTLIPSYIRNFYIKKVSLTIALLEEKHPKALNAFDWLE